MIQPISNEEIDALLDRFRPDRYDVTDTSWRDPVIAEVARRMPSAQARQLAAERYVGDREGRATRSVNNLLREVAATQQWPLPGMVDHLARRPLSIGSERVCLFAATSEDLERWAVDERRDAARDSSARFAACDGAEWLAVEMRSKGLTLFGDAYVEEGAA